MFVDSTGRTVPQGWQVNVGFDNYLRAFTDSRISGPFLGILIWNFAFAILSVLTTFVLGLLVALALNTPRLRGVAVLPAADRAAVRDAVVRDAAGLARHVQHRTSA